MFVWSLGFQAESSRSLLLKDESSTSKHHKEHKRMFDFPDALTFPTDAFGIIPPLPPFNLVCSLSIASCLDLPRISYPVYGCQALFALFPPSTSPVWSRSGIV